MKFDEFKIDGVEIKINDEYALINGTIKIMLSQINEVIINEPDWLGVGRLELKIRSLDLITCFIVKISRNLRIC